MKEAGSAFSRPHWSWDNGKLRSKRSGMRMRRPRVESPTPDSGRTVLPKGKHRAVPGGITAGLGKGKVDLSQLLRGCCLGEL